MIKKVWVDGVEGFEPPNTGTKNQCLTAWRYPNVLEVLLIKFMFFDWLRKQDLNL